MVGNKYYKIDALHRLSWSLDHTLRGGKKINALYYFYDYAFILFTNQPTRTNSYQDLVKRKQIIEQPTEEDMIEEQIVDKPAVEDQTEKQTEEQKEEQNEEQN
ncbi:3537_t:CDS:1 [Paraglomus occultum]|uniref:3537_t:CDS:1 n=1 Tax=Paraglomus occultum TaxID=144539 RepID=A0A9N8ZYX9_9GLOM|nr:3537_t:CDS:1 [Paraglomus occultum]